MVKVKRLSEKRLYICERQKKSCVRDFKNSFQLEEYVRKLTQKTDVVAIGFGDLS